MNAPELLEKAKLGDAAAEDLLMRENMGLVKSVAARFWGAGRTLRICASWAPLGC